MQASTERGGSSAAVQASSGLGGIGGDDSGRATGREGHGEGEPWGERVMGRKGHGEGGLDGWTVHPWLRFLPDEHQVFQISPLPNPPPVGPSSLPCCEPRAQRS